MSELPPVQANRNGPWLVLGLVTVGLVLLVLGLAWWAGIGRSEEAGPVVARHFDRAAAQREAQALGSQLTTAIGGGQASRMLPQLEQLVRRYPGFADAHTLLAQAYIASGRPRSAYEELEKSLQLNPLQAELHELAGTIAVKLNRLDEAEKHYRAAVGQESRKAKPRLLLAQVLIQENKLDEAEKVILQALVLDSNSHTGYALLADVFARQDKLPLALQEIDKAIAHEPANNREVVIQYARTKSQLLRRANRPQEALQVLATLPARERLDMSIMDDMATCYAMMGEPGRAAAMFEQYLILDPTDDRAAARSVHWYLQAHDAANAQRMLQRLRQINPRAVELPDLEAQVKQAARGKG